MRIARGLLCLLLLAGGAAGFVAAAEAPAAPEARTPPATLVLWNRPVATFRASISGNAPAERVTFARRRIEGLSDIESRQPIGTQWVRLDGAEGAILTVGGQGVFGLVADDVDPESGLTLQQVVQRVETQLREVHAARQAQRSLPLLLRAIGLSLAATMLLAVVFWVVHRLRGWGVRRLDDLLRSRRLAIAGVDIVPTLASVERATLRVMSWIVNLSALYLWLTFVLQRFPYTEPLGDRLGEYLRGRAVAAVMSLGEALPQLGVVVAILLITRAFALWIARLLAEVEHGANKVHWLEQNQARATRRILVALTWLVGVVIAYALLPWSNNVVFQGISVVIGIGLSLASSGLFSQWISGIVILYSRMFRLGDFVTIGSVEGYVTEMGPLATKLRTVRREEITIPNAVVTSDPLTNYARLAEGDGSLLSTALSVGYDVAWQQVKALLLQAAAETEGIRKAPAPSVLQWELSDFAVAYRLHVHLERAEERAIVRSALNARILDVFTAAGVQIMVPHYEHQPEKRVVAATAAGSKVGKES